jgi:hypothetical protein
MAEDPLVPMDADVYENQLKPWLGTQRFAWADAHTRPGPRGIRLVPRALRDAFVRRANQRAITDAEEEALRQALPLPGDAPDWDQREIYNRDR